MADGQESEDVLSASKSDNEVGILTARNSSTTGLSKRALAKLQLKSKSNTTYTSSQSEGQACNDDDLFIEVWDDSTQPVKGKKNSKQIVPPQKPVAIIRVDKASMRDNSDEELSSDEESLISEEDASSTDSELSKDEGKDDYVPDSVSSMSGDSDLDFDSEDCVDSGSDRDRRLKHRSSNAFERKCNYCPMEFKSLLKAQRHMKKEHKEYRAGICGICKKKVGRSRGVFLRHVNSHNIDRLHVCDLCGKAFIEKNAYTKHVANHIDPSSASLPCPICSKLLRTELHLEAHMKIHISFTCDFCSKEVKGRRALFTHILAHAKKKPFKCAICGAKFSQKDNRDTHMRNNHNYVCLVCSCKFFKTEDVKRHLKTDHSKKEIKACVGNDLAYEKVTKFQCEVCSRYLASKQSLDFHMATHTGSGKKRPGAKKKEKL